MLKQINSTSHYEYLNGILSIYILNNLVFWGKVEDFMIEDTISELEEEGILISE